MPRKIENGLSARKVHTAGRGRRALSAGLAREGR
jgi:hypothetical protein